MQCQKPEDRPDTVGPAIAWRLFDFPVHEHNPTVIPRLVHLDNGQRVIVTEERARQKAQQPPKTTPTSFFDLCTFEGQEQVPVKTPDQLFV